MHAAAHAVGDVKLPGTVAAQVQLVTLHPYVVGGGGGFLHVALQVCWVGKLPFVPLGATTQPAVGLQEYGSKVGGWHVAKRKELEVSWP